MATAGQLFWVVAVPNECSPNEPENVITSHQRLASALRDRASVHQLDIPQQTLKVGTLDSLMALSDELNRLDSQVDTTLKTIRKTYDEVFKNVEADKARANEGNDPSAQRAPGMVVAKSPLEIDAPTVKGVDEKKKVASQKMSPEDYVKNFHWWTRKLDETKKLRELAAKISKAHARTEVDMKKAFGRYNELRSVIKSIERKEQGTLLIRPLDAYVNQDDILETETFTSLMIVVQSAREQDFLDQYETMEQTFVAKQQAKEAADLTKKDVPKEERSESAKEAKHDAASEEQPFVSKVEDCFNVVPGSARKLYPVDNKTVDEFVLYRVVIMRKGLNRIKQICRENRYTVREYEYDSKAVSQANAVKQLNAKEQHKALVTIVQFCRTNFSELFQFWIHLKAIRTVVEAVLRYGLPINMCASVISIPRPADRERVRAILGTLYKHLDQSNLTGELDSNEMDISGLGSDFYPYVYLTIQL
jgi:V-type H+-transporting ATPase subunit C